MQCFEKFTVQQVLCALKQQTGRPGGAPDAAAGVPCAARQTRDGGSVCEGTGLSMRDQVTQRIQEVPREASFDMLDRVLASAGMGAWRWRPGEQHLEVSPVAAGLLGLGDASTLAMVQLPERFIPQDRPRLQSLFTAPDPDSQLPSLVLRRLSESGELQWLRISGCSVAMQRARAAELLGTIEDVSAMAMDALAMAACFSGEPLLHLVASTSGTVTWVNEAWETVLGVCPAQLQGRPLLELLHPDDRERTASELERTLALTSAEAMQGTAGRAHLASLAGDTGTVSGNYEFSNRYRHSDGSYRIIQWSAVLLVDEQLLYGIGRDITQHRETERRLEEVAAVFSSTGEGVIITDTDGMIRDVNAAFTRITGYTAEEVRGRNTAVLASGRHDARFFSEMWKELRDKGIWRGEMWNRRKDGEIYPQRMTLSRIRAENGEERGYVSVFSDVSGIKKAEEQLQFLAYHDPLTKLPNRELVKEHLSHAIARCRRSGNKLALMFLDLDGFKNVNDSLGHLAGDNLLQQAAERLQQALRAEDSIGRIGGDEFVIMIEGVQQDADVAPVAEKVVQALRPAFHIEGREVSVSGSLGISLYPDDGESVTTLMRNADSAMYSAKDGGRDQYRFYSQQLTTRAFEHVLLDNALRAALEREEFRVAYQPQVNLESGQIIGLEALLRWQHPAMGTMAPGRFIPHAERCGLITPIGNWVMETACRQGVHWLEQGLDFGHVAVNVAAPQFAAEDFLESVNDCLRRTGLPPHHLELEITESILLRDSLGAIQRMRDLRALGVRFSIDDFGTGYSSLSYLNRMPIDRLKLDRSFVSHITTETSDQIIAEAVVALGKAMSISVLAEGVETQQQAEMLLGMGCVQGQGFRYSIPLYPDRLEPFLFRHCRRS